MNAPLIQIRGFSATAEKPVELNFVPTKEAGRPVQTSHYSRPILELLSGARSLAATATLLRGARNEPPPEGAKADAAPIALKIFDPENPTAGIAYGAQSKAGVIPALRLSAAAGKWTAEPLLLAMADDLLKPDLQFYSPSVAALLALTERAFSRILISPKEAPARYAHLMQGGTQFAPNEIHARKWLIACNWPDWQYRRLPFPARALELSRLESKKEMEAETFKQLCFRPPMHLVRGDTTD